MCIKNKDHSNIPRNPAIRITRNISSGCELYTLKMMGWDKLLSII
jgi:hypothetical protein